MEKKSLMTIGELSKLTGTSVRSLRYYENLGILKPVYVDPDSNYRYYEEVQGSVVEAIQMCVEMDIPLSEFNEFFDGKYIQYHKLLECGEKNIEQKLQEMNSKKQYIEYLKYRMEHGEQRVQRECGQWRSKEHVLWITPYERSFCDTDFRSIWKELDKGDQYRVAKRGTRCGLIRFYKGDQCEQYFYIVLQIAPEEVKQYKSEHLYIAEAGDYMCKTVKGQSSYEDRELFPEYFGMQYDKIVAEFELFTKEYKFYAPMREVRCLMPPKAL